MHQLATTTVRALFGLVACSVIAVACATSTAHAQEPSLDVTIRLRVGAPAEAATPPADAAQPSPGEEEISPTIPEGASAAASRLRLLDPAHAPRLGANTLRPPASEGEGMMTLLGGVLCLGLSTVGIAAVVADLPTFGEQWPDWASAVLGLSLPFSAGGLLSIGAGVGLAVGTTEDEIVAVAGAIELALATIMGVVGVAIAPGIGADWGDPITQAHTSELLALGALSYGVIGITGVLLGALEEPTDSVATNLAVAPVVTPTTAGVQLGGRY